MALSQLFKRTVFIKSKFLFTIPAKYINLDKSLTDKSVLTDKTHMWATVQKIPTQGEKETGSEEWRAEMEDGNSFYLYYESGSCGCSDRS